MVRRKKKTVEEKPMELSVEQKLKNARERRIKLAGLTVKKVEEGTREEFRKYFTRIKRQLNLASDLEEVIWLHLKASGFDKKDKFEQGINHFGYKL